MVRVWRRFFFRFRQVGVPFYLLAVVASATVSFLPCAAQADDSDILSKLNDLTKLVQQQQSELSNLENKLVDRDKKIDELENRLNGKKNTTGGAQAVAQASPDQTQVAASPSAPAVSPAPDETTSPNGKKHKKKAAVDQQVASAPSSGGLEQVGEAPANNEKPPEIPILADTGGILTSYGTLIVEPFLDYSRSSATQFFVNGVSPVVGFLVGDITANKTTHDLLTGGSTFRLGVTDRLELEAKVPFVWRQDSFLNSVPGSNGLTTTETSNGQGLGDIELAAHYQINNGQEDWPFFIANMRLKTATGTSPYDQPFRADGTSSTLATGSGFTAIEPSMTAIYPIDPAVLFANLGYIHSFDEDVNKTILGNSIGNVAPGDTFVLSLGMGVALNDRLSFMIGYEQDYVRPTVTIVNGLNSYSDTLVMGSALSGISFKVNDRVHVNLNLAAGVTRDAPDTEVTIRVPIALQVFGPSSSSASQ